jgi:hypothetical protein
LGQGSILAVAVSPFPQTKIFRISPEEMNSHSNIGRTSAKGSSNVSRKTDDGRGGGHLLYGGRSTDFNNSSCFSFIQSKPAPDGSNDNPSFTHPHRAYGKAARREIDLILTRLTQLNATIETFLSVNLSEMVGSDQLKQIIKRLRSFAAKNWVGVGIV